MKHLYLVILCLVSALACHAQFTTYSQFDVQYKVVTEPEYLMPNEIKDFNRWKAENPNMTDEACLLYINSARAQDNLIEAPATIIDYNFTIVKDGDAAGAVEMYVELINSTTKTIKSITLQFEFTDAYGQQLYDMKTGDKFCVLTYNNLSGRTASNQYVDISNSILKTYHLLKMSNASYRKLFYNSKVSRASLNSVKIVYADGTTSNKAALWHYIGSDETVTLLKYGPLSPAMQFAHGQSEKTDEKPQAKKVEPKNDGPVYKGVDMMPSYPGGDAALMRYVNSHIDWSNITDTAQGTVVVQFVVQKDGSIGEVKVARGVEYSLDQEAIRITKSLPKFNPGRQNGECVNVWYTMPISFRRLGAY